jgi:hypothetical protein
MTLQEGLTSGDWISSEDGRHYELFQPASGMTIRVALLTTGAARVSAFDCQMSWKWSADFTPDVDDALIAAFLDAAEGKAGRASSTRHRRSIFPATRGEHKGRHYCVACTVDVDDYTRYVDWPCPDAVPVSSSSTTREG